MLKYLVQVDQCVEVEISARELTESIIWDDPESEFLLKNLISNFWSLCNGVSSDRIAALPDSLRSHVAKALRDEANRWEVL